MPQMNPMTWLLWFTLFSSVLAGMMIKLFYLN